VGVNGIGEAPDQLGPALKEDPLHVLGD
jgi:hypothetical protein